MNPYSSPNRQIFLLAGCCRRFCSQDCLILRDVEISVMSPRSIFVLAGRSSRWILRCCIALGFAVGMTAHAADSKGLIEARVTNQLVHETVEPFTATIGHFGNSVLRGGSGFEPVIFRTKITAIADSADRVVGTPEQVAHWDTLKEGALDGSEVRVYRIEQGQLSLVREDRVAQGGFSASGWWPVLAAGELISPDGEDFLYRWSSYGRPDATEYFTVRAVYKDGRCSIDAAAVPVKSPENIKELNDKKPLSKPNAVLKVRRMACRAEEVGSQSLPAPSKLRGEVDRTGELHLRWDPVRDARLAGYRVYHSDIPPQQHKGYHLQLSGRAKNVRERIRADDMVIVGKKFYTASRATMHSNRVFEADSENRIFMPDMVSFYPDESSAHHWKLEPHAPGTQVSESGETFLRLELAAGSTRSIGAYTYAGMQQRWYPVLKTKPYQVEVWLRRRGTGTVRFELTGFYGKRPNEIPPIEFHPTNSWQKFTVRFTPGVIQDHASPGQMLLRFTGPGEFDIDNFRVFEADTEFLDYSPEEYARLRDSGMAALRTHGLIKTRRRTYDLEQLTNPGGLISAYTGQNTLPQTLKMLHRAGVRPWLQIEPHLNEAEWLGLVEYLAAPYEPGKDAPAEKPWAYKRYAQGQLKPWTDAFPVIDLELGNETWNRLFRPWVFESMTDAVTGRVYRAGEVYGLYQEYVIGVMRQSPYWASANFDQKIRWFLGGRANSRFGSDAASSSPSSAGEFIAAYNGGWDEGKGPPEELPASYAEVLGHTADVAIPVAKRHVQALRSIGHNRSSRLLLGTYEAGPGYALNGLNKAKVTPPQAATQERVMKSMAAATATLDAFLARQTLGMQIQNFFTFGEGPLWKSHAPWHRGGHAYPAWALLSMYNRELAGSSMVSVVYNGRVAQTTSKSAPLAKYDVPEDVSAYAFAKPDQLAVVLISRKVPNFPDTKDDGFRQFRLSLPFRSAKSLEILELQGRYDGHNVHESQVQLIRKAIGGGEFGNQVEPSSLPGMDRRGLAPASTMLLLFKGLNKN